MDHTTEATCYHNDTCVWDGVECVGVSVLCPNRITRDECHRGADCVFVVDTGECVARNQSILAYTRCEAHHAVNLEQGTSSNYPAYNVIQACVNDTQCDWDGYRERCVPLRNTSCLEDAHAQSGATECRARVGCYWSTLIEGGECRAFAWDGETKCATRDSTNSSYCGSLGTHAGSCVYDTQLEVCQAPASSRQRHTSYAWRSYCAHSLVEPLTGTANTTECAQRAPECAVTWDPMSVDVCTPSGETTKWCDTLQTETICDLYSYCYYAVGSNASSSPRGPLTRGCFARDSRLGTDGWRDDWLPFVSDVYVVASEVDSLYVRLEAVVVVPQSTSDQGDAAQARLWDVFIAHGNASAPNHWVSSLSGALGAVGGNTSDASKYPTQAVLRAALRTSPTLGMNMYPLLYAYTGRQFEAAREFEGRNTMAIRVAASIPRSDLELVEYDATLAPRYNAFSWNISVHAVNQSLHAGNQVWRVRSVLSQPLHQAHTLVSTQDLATLGNVSVTPVAAVSSSADEYVEWLEFQHVHGFNATQLTQLTSAFTNPVRIRSLEAYSAASLELANMISNARGVVEARELDWLYARYATVPYTNASTETGYTQWWRRTHLGTRRNVHVFVAMDFSSDDWATSTPRGVQVPWISTTQTQGFGTQVLIDKSLAWSHVFSDPWWRTQATVPTLLQNANATVWLTAMNSTGHVVAGPLSLDNTRSVSTYATYQATHSWVDQYPELQPPGVSTQSSLYSDWWDSLNDLSRVALGSALDAVPVINVTTSGPSQLQLVMNATALSYWLVPWFETYGLKQCYACTYQVSYTLEIPIPTTLNASFGAGENNNWLYWDATTPLIGSKMRYVHKERAMVHADLIVLVSSAEALTKERLSHSAAVWAVVIWMCAVVFVVGVILLSRRPTTLPHLKMDETRARLVLADKQERDAQKAKRDALVQRDDTNPFSDVNVVDIQDGGEKPPAVLADPAPPRTPGVNEPDADKDEAASLASQGIRQRLVNAMNPSGRLTARLAKS